MKRIYAAMLLGILMLASCARASLIYATSEGATFVVTGNGSSADIAFESHALQTGGAMLDNITSSTVSGGAYVPSNDGQTVTDVPGFGLFNFAGSGSDLAGTFAVDTSTGGWVYNVTNNPFSLFPVIGTVTSGRAFLDSIVSFQANDFTAFYGPWAFAVPVHDGFLVTTDTVTAQAVPEPASLFVLMIGLAAMWPKRRIA